eukprot:gene13444-19302_t
MAPLRADAPPLEQNPALDDLQFWVYLQPVGLYNVLSSRPPNFLRRSLTYSQRAPKNEASRSGDQLDLNIVLPGALPGEGEKTSQQGLTIFLALCESCQSINEMSPLVSHLVHLRPRSKKTSDAAAPGSSGRSAKISVSVPDAPMINPHLLLFVWDRYPDLGSMVPKKSGCTLRTDQDSGKILGLVPSRELVWSCCIPLSKAFPNQGLGGVRQTTWRQKQSVSLSLNEASVNLLEIVRDEQLQQVCTIHLQDPETTASTITSFPSASKLDLTLTMTIASKPSENDVVDLIDLSMDDEPANPVGVVDGAEAMGVKRGAQGGDEPAGPQPEKNSGSAPGDASAEASRDVTFRFLYSMDKKYVEEITGNCSCPLCCMSCRDFKRFQGEQATVWDWLLSTVLHVV